MEKAENQVFNGTTSPGNDIKITKTETNQFPGQNVNSKHSTKSGIHSGYREDRLLSFDEFVAHHKMNTKTIEKESMSGPKQGDDGYHTLE